MTDRETYAIAYAEFAGRVDAAANLLVAITDAERLELIRAALADLNKAVGWDADPR